MKTIEGKKNVIGLLLAIVLLAAALLFYKDSLWDILQGIRALSPGDVAVCSLLGILFYILEGTIITGITRQLYPAYPWGAGVGTAFCCEFYRLITFGSGAGLAEIYYLSQKGVDPAQGTGISMIQFILKKISVMLWGVFGFVVLLALGEAEKIRTSYGSFMILGCFITVLIVGVMMSVIVSDKMLRLMLWCLDRIAGKFSKWSEKAQNLKEKVTLFHTSGRMIFARKKVLFYLVGLNLVKFLTAYFIPTWIFMRQCGKFVPDSFSAGVTAGILDGGLPPLECILLMAVIYMLAGVIPAPSGIGSLEFVFLLFFGAYYTETVAVPAILVFRYATWILPFVLGGVIALAQKRTHSPNTNKTP